MKAQSLDLMLKLIHNVFMTNVVMLALTGLIYFTVAHG